MTTVKNSVITDIPIEDKVTTKKEKNDETVSKAQFEQLQETYRIKCMDYDKLVNAYKALIIRYSRDGENAKQFIKTAFLGINLIFPEDKKGE